MFFRRPQFLKEQVAELDEMFRNMTGGRLGATEGEITYQFAGKQRTFQAKDLYPELAVRKSELKEEWLIRHFAQWQAFVDHKIKCGLEVITVPETTPLITSDNPVCIFDPRGRLNNGDPFHRHNMIEIPLNRRTYLIIHPNETSEEGYNYLHRSERDEYFANGVNHKVQENSDQRIIAFPGDLQKHFVNHQRLDQPDPENLKALDNLKLKLKVSLELQEA